MRRSLSQRVPTRGSLRDLVVEVLPGDADLDAFCSDLHEREVYRRFTAGMDRVQKITLLLDHADHGALLDDLRRLHPEAVGRHEHRLAWKPASPLPVVLARRALLAAVPVLVVAGILAGWWLTRIPSIEPFERDVPGIVLGGLWLATADGEGFCRQLGKLEGTHAVDCIAVHVGGASAGELTARARDAGAAVVATITDRGEAQVSVIGALEKNELFGGTIAVDLAHAPDRERAMLVMNALAHLGGPRPGLANEHAPCPAVGPEPLSRVALLALLLVPACEAVKLDPRRYKEACVAAAPDTDETCTLGRYLEAEAYPDAPNARAILTSLRDRGPAPFPDATRLKLARADCKAGRLAEAGEAVIALSRGASGCLAAQLSEVAACIAWQRRDLDPRIAALEGRVILPGVAHECPEPLLASALAGRAHWRGRAGRWQDAARDYEAAYALDEDPLYALGEAEALLHLKRTGEARDLLKTPVAGRDLSVYAALLRWAASRQQDDAIERKNADSALLDLCTGLPAGKSVVEGDADDDLRALVCDAAARPCLYDVLRGPSSRDALKQILDDQAGHGTSR
jgi:hypothetical protein